MHTSVQRQNKYTKHMYENTYYNKIKKFKCLNIIIIIIIIIIINVQSRWRNLPAHSGLV